MGMRESLYRLSCARARNESQHDDVIPSDIALLTSEGLLQLFLYYRDDALWRSMKNAVD